MSSTEPRARLSRLAVKAPATSSRRGTAAPTATPGGRRADAAALAALAGVFAVTVAFTWLTWGHMAGDTGYDLYVGARLAHGDLPYRDVVYYYGPLVPALLAAAFRLFGAQLSTAIALGLGVAFGLVACTYLLARQLLAPFASFLCGSLVAVAVVARPDPVNAVLPTEWSSSLGALLLLAALLCVARHVRRPGAPTAALTGAALAAEAVVKPEYAVYLGAALLLLAAVRLRAGQERLSTLGVAAAVACLVPLAVYGGVLLAVPAHDLLDGLLPSAQLSASGFHAYRAESPLDAHHVGALVGRALAYLAGAAVLAYAGSRLLAQRPSRALVGTAVAAAGCFLVIGLVPAAPGHHAVVVLAERIAHSLTWLSLLAGATLAVLLVRAAWPALRRGVAPEPSAQLLLALACIATLTVNERYAALAPARSLSLVVSLGAVLLAQLQLVWLPRGSAGAVRAGLAWLTLLACACAVEVVTAARAESVVVHAPLGDFRAAPSDAAAYQGAIDALARLGPGARVVVGPQAAALLFLTGDRTPLREASLLPGAFGSAAAEARAAQALERNPPDAAAITYQNLDWFGQTRFGVSFMQRLDGALRATLPSRALYRGSGLDPLTIEVRTRG